MVVGMPTRRTDRTTLPPLFYARPTLTVAEAMLGITLADNRLDLMTSRLRIEDRGLRVDAVSWGPRLGIRVGADRPWRCWVTGHPAVSGPR